MSDTVIKFDHVSKEYRLGSIGGGSLKSDLQKWWAQKKGREDPYATIGSVQRRATGERFLALDDISFKVNQGDALGIIGRNGAGKSTLLKLLSRVTAPTKGTISYKGRVASMLEVGTGFHGELTGRENVYLNGAILGMTRAEVARKFDEIVSFAEMEQFIDTPVKRYSSGMYVKLAFAVAAHLDNEILVMDEVLAVGDMKFQQKCLGRMEEAAEQEGRTVLYVSHNMNTIKQLCNRCIYLDHGKIIHDGDIETSINLYSDTSQKMQKFYDFTSIKRPVTRSLKLEFLNLDIENDTTKPLVVGEAVNLSIGCRANKEFSGMMLRFEVIAPDGSVAGTMFLKDKLSMSAGTQFILNLGIDTAHFAPSLYRFDLLAFEANEFGIQDWVDRVEGAMILEFHKKSSTDLEWLSQSWGYTKFNDMTIISLCVKDKAENLK